MSETRKFRVTYLEPQSGPIPGGGKIKSEIVEVGEYCFAKDLLFLYSVAGDPSDRWKAKEQKAAELRSLLMVIPVCRLVSMTRID